MRPPGWAVLTAHKGRAHYFFLFFCILLTQLSNWQILFFLNICRWTKSFFFHFFINYFFLILFYFKYFFLFYFLTLQYCIGLAIYQNGRSFCSRKYNFSGNSLVLPLNHTRLTTHENCHLFLLDLCLPRLTSDFPYMNGNPAVWLQCLIFSEYSMHA